MRGIGRINKSYRTIRRKLVPGGLILAYHRVMDLSNDSFSLAVSPLNFRSHLEYLRKECHPMRLTDFVGGLEQKKIPPRAVVITFDDGYIDNFEQACPLLLSAGIPATFFLTGEFIGGQREMWWDELERILINRSEAGRKFTLNLNDKPYEWTLNTHFEANKALFEIQKLMKPLPSVQQQQIIDDLYAWSGLPKKVRLNYRGMKAEEVQQLSNSELFEIGAHTDTHPCLSSLTPSAIREEILRGCEKLERIIQKPVKNFAYPYGKQTDIPKDAAAIVKETGFRSACTTIIGAVEGSSDPFMLKRCGVHNWELILFEQFIKNFFIS